MHADLFTLSHGLLAIVGGHHYDVNFGQAWVLGHEDSFVGLDLNGLRDSIHLRHLNVSEYGLVPDIAAVFGHVPIVHFDCDRSIYCFVALLLELVYQYGLER